MNSWEKDILICSCGNKFTPHYCNGLLISKLCPNCKLRQSLKTDNSENDGIYQNRKQSLKTSKISKRSERQKAMDRADEWFSKYIRLKYSFESGGELFCKCYTCGNPKPMLEIENGHWQRRGFKTTRFHENDARPQCTQCNHFKSGEPEKFELNLIRDIGQQKVNELKILSQQIGEDNEIFYREQAGKYRKLFNFILKERNLINPWK